MYIATVLVDNSLEIPVEKKLGWGTSSESLFKWAGSRVVIFGQLFTYSWCPKH